MGDFMMHDAQINSARDSNGKYDFNDYFEYTGSLINNVDFAVANLETTLGGKPYKGYSLFSSPDEYVLAIQNAGFNILTTANNHCNDTFHKGIIRTIDVLDSLNLDHIGTYKN